MSERDRARWEKKYGENAGEQCVPALASLAWVPPAPRGGLALDLACGRGRHCQPLLTRGYRVVAVDIAAGALRRIDAIDDTHVILRVQADLDTWPFTREVFDLVLQCDFLDRRLFSALKDSVRPGGYVLIDTFCGPATDGRGPSCADYRLERGELLRVFASWGIQRIDSSDEAREAILARKPQF